jgi:hypothetical protein
MARHDGAQIMYPEWTQEEAVKFECARETITHVMAIVTADIAKEEGAPVPDRDLLLSFAQRRSALARERENLRLKDHAEIDRIFNEYGKLVRDRRAHDTQNVA